MSSFLNNNDRKVVPRWRSFETTSSLGELGPSQRKGTMKRDQRLLERKIKEWNENRSLSFAADLISSAVSSGLLVDAKNAAEYVLNHSAKAPSAVVNLARKVLLEIKGDSTRLEIVERLDARSSIKKIKKGLSDDPRDAILWIGIAREYTILGQFEKAKRAFEIALAINKSNRFVLRTAARFYVHMGEAERALWLLRSEASTKTDPWLLSAEIAVSSVLDRRSKLIRTARELIERREFSSFHISELASALGTIELFDGKKRQARKLFQEALVEPTENSVAQADWAARVAGEDGLDVKYLRVPLSFEARAWRDFFLGNWKKSLSHTLDWINDQPFSSRPAVHASYLTATVLEDYEKTIQVVNEGLIANPNDSNLLNNLVFALCSLDRVNEARPFFEKINVSDLSPSELVAYTATAGLLSFRSGEVKQGRSLYLKAIDLAKHQSDRKRAALSSMYLAREELIAGLSSSIDTLGFADRQVKGVRDKDIEAVAARLRDHWVKKRKG